MKISKKIQNLFLIFTIASKLKETGYTNLSDLYEIGKKLGQIS